ncbi:TPA: DMT family transporter [Clostridium botulinum]|uniref:EamA family transporter n=1 Tax=Clostridium botulinum TaxID=1491 RepID=A0A6B4FUP8_CLOBO|nr:DMT family transporter [Clostridium botulinum]APC79639.1 eamA-like transporter family protein [Clostridium botulinum]MBN3368805.1 EamA family transporter [Clostridium botulinum]MBN3376770.1 EamA family transporter [Clostridium botulinum]MBN3381170.1 EamA family transporter [Clostridium botulinum]MBN3389677.1 EamA family transporter [Clostridium botulinum]
MKFSHKKKAYVSAILYSIIIGFSFLFSKMSLTFADPLDTLAHRFTVSFIFAFVSVLLGWIKLDITKKDILSILPLSLFYPIMFFGFQIFGLVYIASSEAGIIQATIPIFTMIFSVIFLKERPSVLQKLSILLSVAGVVYIFFMKGVNLKSNIFIGIVLILLSALSSSGNNVLARKMSGQYKPISLTYTVICIGFVFFNIMSIINHSLNGTLNIYFKPFTNPLFIVSIFYLGILSSLVTSFLLNYSLSKIEASKMSVFNNLSTLITMMAGVVFLGEKLQYFHIIGSFMIILGIVGTNLGDKLS